ncbi:MAG: hypothetical protein ACXVW0_03630 [Nocardioides sp.]
MTLLTSLPTARSRRARYLAAHPDRVLSLDVELLLLERVPGADAARLVQRAHERGVTSLTMYTWLRHFPTVAGAELLVLTIEAGLSDGVLLRHLVDDRLPARDELLAFSGVGDRGPSALAALQAPEVVAGESTSPLSAAERSSFVSLPPIHEPASFPYAGTALSA